MRTRGYGRAETTGTRGLPSGYADWYDWALVYRYWHGNHEGLRQPYLREIEALLRLGAGLKAADLACQVGVSQRTIERWRALLPHVPRPAGTRGNEVALARSHEE